MIANFISTFAMFYLIQYIGSANSDTPFVLPLTIVLLTINIMVLILTLIGLVKLLQTQHRDAFIVYASHTLNPAVPVDLLETAATSCCIAVIAGFFYYYGWSYSAGIWLLLGVMTTTFHSRTRKYLTDENVKQYLYDRYLIEMDHKKEKNEPTMSFEKWLEQLRKSKEV